jgi:Zn finger protein HypA/HybF involved in hydrogenase expression
MESVLFIIIRNHGCQDILEETKLAKCKKCGTVVSSPKKKWTMAGRPSKAGKRTQLEIGLFDCPKCKKPFREVLSKKII